MIGDTAALACAVLAIVRRDGAPPDPQNNAAALAGNKDGDGKLGAKWAQPSQHDDDTRYRIALAIILTWAVVTAADAYTGRFGPAPQGWTAPASWKCSDAWDCDIAERGP